MTTKLSAKDAAKEIGTDARTLRKFIRSAKDLPISPVGQGARYEFTSKEVKALKKAFLTWSTKGTKSEKTKVKITGTDEEVETNTDHDIELTPELEAELLLDELTGPSDEELEEIDIDDEDLDLD